MCRLREYSIASARNNQTLRYLWFSSQAHYRAEGIVQQGRTMRFIAHRPELPPLSVHLNLAGTHNVQNALAAIAVATELEIPDEAIITGLVDFSGVARRFECYGDFPIAGGFSL